MSVRRLAALVVLLTAASVSRADAQADSAAAQAAADQQGAAGDFLEPISEPYFGDLDSLLRRRSIRVLITPTRTQYWVDRGHQVGFEYEVLKAFERWLNRHYQTDKNIKIDVVLIPSSRADLVSGLVEGRGDIAAGILTATPERLQQVDFAGPFFHPVTEIVVAGKDSPALTRIEDLSGRRVMVRKSSSYWSHLEALNRAWSAAGSPPMLLEAAPEHLTDEDILEMVNAGLIETTVVHRYAARLWSSLLPKLRVHEALVVNDSTEVGWLIRKDSPQLKAEIERFAHQYGRGTRFGNSIVTRYTGSTKFLKDALSPAALERYRTTVGLFRRYSARYSLDPLLMMAQGYQESELKQWARSPVGAIGVMQIMPATGDELGVGDITQLEPNIHGGIKYMRGLIDQHFAKEQMSRLHQTLFAFAAYNAGPGRVRRLRAEAAKRGLDPNVWHDNVEVIAAHRIGAETVGYVSNIYKYYVAYSLMEREEALRVQESDRPR